MSNVKILDPHFILLFCTELTLTNKIEHIENPQRCVHLYCVITYFMTALFGSKTIYVFQKFGN